ncbi:MAG: hypothetical protein K6D96_08135 [Acetatifactor sp.]|nr:hypothetical protein [Acetatifactor sp.]
MKILSKNASENIKNLRFLERAKVPEGTLEEYKKKRSKKCFLTLGVFVVISLILLINEILGNGSGNVIRRNDYGDGDNRVKVSAKSLYGEEEFDLDISQKRYSAEKLSEMYPEFVKKLGTLIRGENADLNVVTKKLELTEKVEGFPYEIEWVSADETVLTNDGEVFRGDKDKNIELKVNIRYGDFFHEESFDIKVLAYSKEEKFWLGLKDKLLSEEENTKAEDEFVLPDTYEGQSLKWHVNRDRTWLMVLIMGIPVTCMVFFMSDRDLFEKVQKIKKQYKNEYPHIVRKIGLYTGAGLTLRGTFKRLSKDYAHYIKEEDTGKSLMCELLRESVNRFDMGESEIKVYEDFGKATGVSEYIRLSGLLVRNLKKGSRAFHERIREESAKAEAMKIENGKKLGEEASAKLLVPMVMMLLIIMILLMIPAFSGMGI